MFPKAAAMMLGAGRASGLAFAWGINSYGIVGDGTTVNKSSPVQLGTRQWVSQAQGGYHQALVGADGTLWAIGKNNNGQLGDGTTTAKSSPVQIGALTNWSRVYAGVTFTLGVKRDGTLWAWGANSSGQLGDGTTVDKSSPVQIGALTDWGGAKFAAGGNHWVAVKSNGTLWTCGIGGSGQLGDNTGLSRSSPIQVGALTDWKLPGACYRTSLCVKANGTLWGWGNSTKYQLWTNTGPGSPVQLGAGATWDQIGTGFFNDHVLATKTDGSLWAWGANDSGQLGLGSTSAYRTSPTQVGALTDWTPSTSAIERRPALQRKASQLIKADGTLWTFGVGSAGALGDGTAVSKSSPVQIGSGNGWLGVFAAMYGAGALSR